MNYKRFIKQIAIAIPNIGRGIGTMIFNAILYYLLNKQGNEQLLTDYTWFLISSYLLTSVTGWGLRDYSVKTYVQNMNDQARVFAGLLSSKIPLLLLSFVVIIFLRLESNVKMLLAFLVFLKTFMALFDPLLLVNKKTTAIFITELVIYLASIISLWAFPFLKTQVILLLVLAETARVLCSLVILYPLNVLSFRYRPFRGFLYNTRFYFLIALFSFFMSRIDSYILGFLTGGKSFPHYNMVLNLVAVSQIIIAAIYNNSMKPIFRMDLTKAMATLSKLQIQFVFLSIVAVGAIFICTRVVYQIILPPECYLLLLVNIYCFCLTIKYLVILNHSNRLSLFLSASILSSCANVIFAVVLIPGFQLRGALFANTCASIVLVAGTLFFMKRKVTTMVSQPVESVVLDQDR